MRPKLSLIDEVEQLFSKKFEYQKPVKETWTLPLEQSLFSEFYQYESLQTLKEELNAVKSKLNNYGVQEWSSHTNRRDPSGEISWRLKNKTNAEFVTVAWCKLYECLHRYPLVKKPDLNSLHLCEAPGAFIAALNHYLHSIHTKNQIKWRWRGTTLNPYYEGNALNEMVTDDRLIYHTLDNWLFHEDLTGNLLDVNNIQHMTESCASEFPAGVQLITADGSIDCSAQPDCQEEIVMRLFCAEILSALSILGAGGNFLIKMFTLYEASSVCLLYMLNCSFQQVHLFKPATSKRGNSEVYVICLNYQPQTAGLPRLLDAMRLKLADPQNPLAMPLIAKSLIPKDFLLQHEIACRRFLQLQVQAIESSIYAYESKDRVYLNHLHQLRGYVTDMYYKRYKVRELPPEHYLVQGEQLNTSLGFTVPYYGGSFTEREIMRQGDILKQIYCLRRDLNQLEKCPSGNGCFTHRKQLGDRLTLEPLKATPVQTLQSSLFASEPVLLLRVRLLETFELDPLWQAAPKCLLYDAIGTQLKVINYAGQRECPYYELQQRFFKRLLTCLLELRPARLVFKQCALLSHFAVSLLRYLSDMVYDQAEFEQNPAEQTITLTGELQLEALKQLQQLLELQHTTLHSVVRLQLLHKNSWSRALLLYNNSVLLASYRRMLDEQSFPVEQEPVTLEIKETSIVC
ncbi:aft [Drosophila busckii]|uniref:Cap-specific mRNA (nucleoside-2'-O-)-methyltransferase 2 n=1 Tax=Drosophila busckii TaxID=30019 RepID=A0A0M4EWT4_DROBS|nr:aft [Drosophila busckii]